MKDCVHWTTYLGSIYNEKTGEREGTGVIDVVCEKGHTYHMMLCIIGLAPLCRSYEHGEHKCTFTSFDPTQRERQYDRICRAAERRKELGTYDYKREEMWTNAFDCINETFDRCWYC